MQERLDEKTIEGNSDQWNYIPPKWWRVSVLAVPFAIVAETIAVLIAIEPHPKFPTAQIWGITFCMCIPTPLIWLRNGNRHFRNLIAGKAPDPAVLRLIAYFSVGLVVASYLLIALLITNLYLVLQHAG
ncbi:MAG: hypothetical protein ACRD59_03805 [Candidatus Acidiferrales bacterium]